VLNITIDTANITSTVGPHMYGSGIETYENQLYGGLWSNMVYDGSFEDTVLPPNPPPSAGGAVGAGAGVGVGVGSDHRRPTSWDSPWYTLPSPPSSSKECSVSDTDAFNGKKSMQLAAGCIVRNRGVNADPSASSMHFVGGKHYEGYLFARSSTAGGTLRLSLLCTPLTNAGFTSNGTVLAFVDIMVSASSSWTQHYFNITTSNDCLQVGGKDQGLVQVELLPNATTDDVTSTVNIDELMVEPGGWGRYNSMHIRKDLAETFLEQGPTIMRLGGSMTNAPGFRFKYMVGPVWSRCGCASLAMGSVMSGLGLASPLMVDVEVPLSVPRTLLCMKLEHSCDQRHSSRVFTPLTS
jgi:hypothetical protein